MEGLTRLRMTTLHDKVMSAEEALQFIKDETLIGLSGFGGAGEAKSVPLALAEYAKRYPLKITLATGASLGNKIDGHLDEAGIIVKRYPYQADAVLRKSINSGKVNYIDMHLSHMADNIRHAHLPAPKVVIIAAVAITEDGHIIPTASVGNSAVFADLAEQIIVEIDNTINPLLEGVHDVYVPEKRPARNPIPLIHPNSRVGTVGIKVDPAKIVAVVFNDIPDTASNYAEGDDETAEIAKHLIRFFEDEVAKGKLPKNLGPLQSGVGSICNAVFTGLEHSSFENLEMYSEILQDCVFKLIDSGKMTFASACGMTLSDRYGSTVMQNFEKYKDKVIFRPQEISNNPELIRRLGVIAINTALEFDIYGNVNSSHVMGTNMMNGIGGSGDYARNSHLAVFVTKSIAKNGDISSVVPMVSHVDHTEHDVDILVTEQGLADLRGLSPRERAAVIIQNCVHPLYRTQLQNYFDRACSNGGHTPHLIGEALSWHQHYLFEGSMLKKAAVCA